VCPMRTTVARREQEKRPDIVNCNYFVKVPQYIQPVTLRYILGYNNPRLTDKDFSH
jgi:hypothetical protein